MASWREVVAFSEALTRARDDAVVTATPMRFAQIMRLDPDGAREMVPMRWGFADKRADAPDRPKHMHARCETIDTRPTFAQAFAHARGLLFVRTFNEGEDLPSGKTKQWVITPKDGKPLAIAVICEAWAKGDETLLTFVMATTPASPLIAPITDRMPAILPREAWATWLGETDASLAEVKALLQTYDDGGAWEMAEQAKGGRKPKPPGDGQPSLF